MKVKILTIAIYAIVIFPFVFMAFTAGQYDNTLITDSIPDHSVIIYTLATFVIVGVSILGFRVLYNSKVLWIFWLVSSIWTLSNCVFFYNHIYEEMLFTAPTRLSLREVKVEKVFARDTRSGPRFFASINPNHLKSKSPVLKISEPAFDLLNPSRNSKSVGSINAAYNCFLRVTVETEKSAERIIVKNGEFDDRSVVRCGSKPVS